MSNDWKIWGSVVSLVVLIMIDVSVQAEQAVDGSTEKVHLQANDYVVGQDGQVYRWLGKMDDGRYALKEIWTAGRFADATEVRTGSIQEQDLPVVMKTSDFVVEVEMKSCTDLCLGDRVFQKTGSQMATVDRVFSGGTLLVNKSTTNSIGINTGTVPMLGQAHEINKQEAFNMPKNRGIASTPK